MKLTPEQKAFYEYGRAVESLRGTIYKIRKNALHEFGEPYHLLMRNEQKCLINAMGLASKIHVVRQKRAACRAWMIRCSERTSKNCIHGSKSRYEMPCRECFRSAYALQSEMVGDNWEPRKEASND